MNRNPQQLRRARKARVKVASKVQNLTPALVGGLLVLVLLLITRGGSGGF